MAVSYDHLTSDERDSLLHEHTLHWAADPLEYRYIRESFVCSTRAWGCPLPWWPGAIGDGPGQRRLLGWAELSADAPSFAIGRNSFGLPLTQYFRRVFTLGPDDPTPARGPRSCPIEGVDPGTLSPRNLGRVTEGSFGGPLSASVVRGGTPVGVDTTLELRPPAPVATDVRRNLDTCRLIAQHTFAVDTRWVSASELWDLTDAPWTICRRVETESKKRCTECIFRQLEGGATEEE